MTVWLDEYARPQTTADGQLLVVNAERVLAFLRGLRDRGAPAWQRLQAVREESAGPAGCASGGVGDGVSGYRRACDGWRVGWSLPVIVVCGGGDCSLFGSYLALGLG